MRPRLGTAYLKNIRYMKTLGKSSSYGYVKIVYAPKDKPIQQEEKSISSVIHLLIEEAMERKLD